MKKNLVFITIAIMFSNVLVKCLGLIRDVALANTYGTSIYTDAYIVANNIPIVIFSVVSLAISTSFIPIYSEIKECEDENYAMRFANNFTNIILIISLGIAILGEIFPGLLVNIFAYGFNEEAYNITIQFTRILMPSVIVIGLMSVTGSYLQLNEDFLPISYVTIPNNIIVIISISLAFYTGKPYILAIGTSVGMISQLIYYYPFMKRNGYKHSWYINLKDKYIKKILVMIIPVFIGAAVNEVNVIIDRSLVSGLEQGSVAALNYASKLIGFINGVFLVSIVTIIYPRMSELSAKLELEDLKKYLARALTIISVLVIPITVISIMYSNDFVKIIFERGSFDSKSTHMTSLAFAGYSVGLIGMGFREILTKAYFALKDTKTPMINGMIAVIFNVILNIILIPRIGIIGSAIATSITVIITSLLLVRKLQGNIGIIFDKHFNINIFKITVGSIISTTLGNLLYRINTYEGQHMLNQLISLTIALLGTLIIYIIILLI